MSPRVVLQKSTGSIIAKLQRESIRLSQIQNIAGCRVVVDVVEQDRVVESLVAAFPGAAVVDRRANPQFGYRAVHVIVRGAGKLVEVQVRSPVQHLWAELSEKCSDVFDPAVKYGGGPEPLQQRLLQLSELVARYEDAEVRIRRLLDDVRGSQEAREGEDEIRGLRDEVYRLFANLIGKLETLGKSPQ